MRQRAHEFAMNVPFPLPGISDPVAVAAHGWLAGFRAARRQAKKRRAK